MIGHSVTKRVGLFRLVLACSLLTFAAIGMGGCQATGTSIPSYASSATDENGNPYTVREGTVANPLIKSTIWKPDGSISTESNDDTSAIWFDPTGFHFQGPGTQRALALDWGLVTMRVLAGDDAGLEGLTYESEPIYDEEGTYLGMRTTVGIDKASLAASIATTARMPAMEAANIAYSRMTEAQQQVVRDTWIAEVEANRDVNMAFINAVESVVPGAIDAILAPGI